MTDKYKTSHLPVDQIDKLRFQAFKTNSPADMDAYYRATSSYFQDYPRRAMNCEVKEARIKELEALLLRAEHTIEKSWVTIYPDMEEDFNMDGSWDVVKDIRAALKGESK